MPDARVLVSNFKTRLSLYVLYVCQCEISGGSSSYSIDGTERSPIVTSNERHTTVAILSFTYKCINIYSIDGTEKIPIVSRNKRHTTVAILSFTYEYISSRNIVIVVHQHTVGPWICFGSVQLFWY